MTRSRPSWRPVEVRPVGTRPLRRQVLRPGQSDADLMVPREEDEQSGWYAVMLDDRMIGCAGVLAEPRTDGPENGWRVRAMATDPAFRSAGVGTVLLARCAQHVLERGGGEIWCTARVGAAPFYLDRGFRGVGVPFDLHGLGPHVLMVGDPDVVSRAGRGS